MKLFHLADLHLGKRLYGHSLLPDQKYILQQITDLASLHRPQAVLIAGDIYDRAAPPAEAVELFDSFLSGLEAMGILVFLISGNHDSGTRLAFGSAILKKQGIHMAGHFTGKLTPIPLDGVNIFLLPFVRPGEVRYYLEQEDIVTYHQAVAGILAQTPVASGKKNILLTHQFITGQGSVPLLSQSEISPVGGLDNVDSSVYDAFDYVACGHLHIPQTIGKKNLRYCGSPLKYSFSEAEKQKSVTVLELHEKGEIEISLLPLTPLRAMRVIRGPFQELRAAAQPTEDYVKVILTDFDRVPDPLSELRKRYPNLLNLTFEQADTEQPVTVAAPEKQEPLTLFSKFYESQTGKRLSDPQKKLVKEILENETP